MPMIMVTMLIMIVMKMVAVVMQETAHRAQVVGDDVGVPAVPREGHVQLVAVLPDVDEPQPVVICRVQHLHAYTQHVDPCSYACFMGSL